MATRLLVRGIIRVMRGLPFEGNTKRGRGIDRTVLCVGWIVLFELGCVAREPKICLLYHTTATHMATRSLPMTLEQSMHVVYRWPVFSLRLDPDVPETNLKATAFEKRNVFWYANYTGTTKKTL
jgi:hypothetical protein